MAIGALSDPSSPLFYLCLHLINMLVQEHMYNVSDSPFSLRLLRLAISYPTEQIYDDVADYECMYMYMYNAVSDESQR